MYGKIKLTVEDQVARVTLADPATLNAASLVMMDELTDAFERIGGGDLGVRSVLLTGEGRGFCSGANLADPSRDLPNGGAADAGAALESHYNPFVRRLRELPVPVVTAVNGCAAGIGCSFALLGDIVVAAETAYFLQAFRRIGLVPDGGSTWLLPRLAGKARAMEMALLGEKISARTALEWGLINRVVADERLIDEAMAIARQLATGPASLGLTRRLLWNSMEADWSEQLDAERCRQQDASETADFYEGVQAFFQKRPAAFIGR